VYAHQDFIVSTIKPYYFSSVAYVWLTWSKDDYWADCKKVIFLGQQLLCFQILESSTYISVTLQMAELPCVTGDVIVTVGIALPPASIIIPVVQYAKGIAGRGRVRKYMRSVFNAAILITAAAIPIFGN
jgi:hypothetical protein